MLWSLIVGGTVAVGLVAMPSLAAANDSSKPQLTMDNSELVAVRKKENASGENALCGDSRDITDRMSERLDKYVALSEKRHEGLLADIDVLLADFEERTKALRRRTALAILQSRRYRRAQKTIASLRTELAGLKPPGEAAKPDTTITPAPLAKQPPSRPRADRKRTRRVPTASASFPFYVGDDP